MSTNITPDPPRAANEAAAAHADAIMHLVNEVVANSLENVARSIARDFPKREPRAAIVAALVTEAQRRRHGA